MVVLRGVPLKRRGRGGAAGASRDRGAGRRDESRQGDKLGRGNRTDREGDQGAGQAVAPALRHTTAVQQQGWAATLQSESEKSSGCHFHEGLVAHY